MFNTLYRVECIRAIALGHLRFLLERCKNMEGYWSLQGYDYLSMAHCSLQCKLMISDTGTW